MITCFRAGFARRLMFYAPVRSDRPELGDNRARFSCLWYAHAARTKASLIYRRTKNLRAVQLLLGHTKLESTFDTWESRSTTLWRWLSN